MSQSLGTCLRLPLLLRPPLSALRLRSALDCELLSSTGITLSPSQNTQVAGVDLMLEKGYLADTENDAEKRDQATLDTLELRERVESTRRR